MSLINEALKKAQRQRTDPNAAAAGDPHAGPIEKRGKPMRAQSLLILAAGAAVLIVFSVVITVYLVNRKPPQLATSAPPAPKQVIRSDYADPTPIVVAPIVVPTATSSETKVTAAEPIPAKLSEQPAQKPAEIERSSVSSPTQTDPAPEPSLPAAELASARAQSAEPAPRTAPVRPASDPATFDPRVSAYVDDIKVTGIRSSGNESKVLMNDRVYRVNDIVDRSLSLKLIKVESDTLTFTDANGVVYTKNF